MWAVQSRNAIERERPTAWCRRSILLAQGEITKPGHGLRAGPVLHGLTLNEQRSDDSQNTRDRHSGDQPSGARSTGFV